MAKTPHRHDSDEATRGHDDMTPDHTLSRSTAVRPEDRPAGDRRAGEREVESRRSVNWMPWSPAQMIALAGGVIFMVMGPLAVIRGGVDDIQAHTSVWGLHHTSLMGLITIGFGALLAIAGAVPTLQRGLMVFLGVVALAWGIIVAMEPGGEFHSWLGAHTANGWVYIITGAAILLIGLIAPVVMGSSEVYNRRSASRY